MVGHSGQDKSCSQDIQDTVNKKEVSEENAKFKSFTSTYAIFSAML